MKENLGKVWYENGKFIVAECDYTDPIIGDRVRGYGVINRTTLIRETETRRLAVAVVLADGFAKNEHELEAAIFGEAPPAAAPVSIEGRKLH